mmetsp:Transcript_35078/g.105782  ORF Transcript_35078/g.105782 Transcript_35078/m.105782 type:complete len:462 (+) Transcript_35078:31-1416(+)
MIMSVVVAAGLVAAAVAAPVVSDVEQVHLAQAGPAGMASITVSWLSNKSKTSTVKYGTSSGSYPHSASGDEGESYSFQSAYITELYTSGLIHHVTLYDLAPNTKYYYVAGSTEGGFSAEFSFSTVGPSVQPEPFSFAVMGDLGQTGNSSKTVAHILDGTYTYAMIVGDLSYADSAWKARSAEEPCTQERWDTWGRFIEPLAATVPLMVAPGNHEVEQDGAPPATQTEFLAFQKRFKMPSEPSFAHDGNLYFSYDAAGVHFVMLNSYMDYNASSDQYTWLERDLKAVDRSVTPWVVVSMHAPWYNSNQHHHDEVQELGMRLAMEGMLNDHSVDLVLAGHVHAYERMYNVKDNVTNPAGPVYINIGDGGNREGPCPEYFQQPSWSAFREAAFGHGELQVANSTHMHWAWHRIIDAEPTIGDQVWLVKEKGPLATPVVHGVGKSAKQYDGYAWMLNRQPAVAQA